MNWPVVQCPKCYTKPEKPCLNGHGEPIGRCHRGRREAEVEELKRRAEQTAIRQELRVLNDEEFDLVMETGRMCSILEVLGDARGAFRDVGLLRIIVRLAKRLAAVE